MRCMKSEKQIEHYLGKRIKALGGLCLKWTSPGTAGVPDRIIIMPKGKIYFVELKAEDKKNNLSALQRSFFTKLTMFDCTVEILASFNDVDRFIKELMPSEVHTA